MAKFKSGFRLGVLVTLLILVLIWHNDYRRRQALAQAWRRRKAQRRRHESNIQRHQIHDRGAIHQ